MARAIRWLHLSDLHLGCRGSALWWQLEEDFRNSVTEMAGRLGPPDLVLISGDLTHGGRAEEFATADRFLDALCGWLDEAGGPPPLIVPVPGNHDLIRPQRTAAFAYHVLDEFNQGAGNRDVRVLEEELWEHRDAAFVEPLFEHYQAWLDERILPELERRASAVHRSHFPGDLSIELEIEGTFPLCIVALNSAWLQYREGEYERKLALPVRQFHAALPRAEGRSPLEVFRRCERFSDRFVTSTAIAAAGRESLSRGVASLRGPGQGIGELNRAMMVACKSHHSLRPPHLALAFARALGHISANWNDLDRAGSAGFQPAPWAKPTCAGSAGF